MEVYGKTAYLTVAATFSTKMAQEHILSLGKSDLYANDLDLVCRK